MLQAKFMLLALIALLAVDSTVAIIGGKDAERGQFPYFVYLESYTIHKINQILTTTKRTIYRKCGGSLISKQWILTGAHCLDYSDGAEVYLGVKRLFDDNEVGRKKFDVGIRNYYIHPSYNMKQLFKNDIALIKLPRPVQFSKYIQPIQLSSVPPTTGMEAITAGYGLVSLTLFPHNLQYTKFKITDLKECRSLYLAQNVTPKHSSVCAKDTQSRLCFGDVGGPLVSTRSTDSGKLVGLAIFTQGDCEVGGQGYTGIYAYIKWIDNVMKIFAIN